MKHEKSDVGRVWRLLRRFLGGERRLLWLAFLMLIAEAITAIFAAYPLSYLIDFLKGDRTDLMHFLPLALPMSPRVGTVAVLTLAMILMAMINSAADSMAEIYLARIGRMLGFNLRVGVYDHIQRLSLAFFNRQRTGDILTRVTGDVAALEDFVINALSNIVGSILVLIGTLAYLLYRSWEVALVAALIVPAVAVVSEYFAQRIKVAAKRQRACEGDLASAAQEMLTSIGVIQTYGRGGSELERFTDWNRKTIKVALEAARLQALFSWVVKVLQAACTVSIIWLGLWLMEASTITLGTLLLFVILIGEMFKPTRKIIKEWNRFGKMYASAERIVEVLDSKPEVQDAPDARPAPPLEGRVEYRHVHFAYRVEDDDGDALRDVALRDVSLRIAPGEALGLVGASGAGKTTIGLLLPRLYDPKAGQVLIDGHDIRRFTLESLRAQISMVLQETVLFNGTVAANIGYGCDGPTREEIVAAAVQANAHEFIEKLPQGYDTELGERAASLSGGQRQRIAIARAFIRRTPILILDEPTTGLDAESIDLVRTALETLMKGRTTIIISHDLNLMRDAHRIAVIRDGEIEREGTHEELLEGGGLYAELYGRQFGRAVEEQVARIRPRLAPPAHQHLAEDFEEDAEEFQLTTPAMPATHATPPPAAPQKLATMAEPPAAVPSSPAPPHRAVPARMDQADVDPRCSPVLLRELRGLPAAFDGEAMNRRLQTRLLGGPGGRFTIARCEPAEAGYLPDGTCLVRYRLEIRDAETGSHISSLVSARLFPHPSACAEYARRKLSSVAGRMHGRPELFPFATPVATIETLSMALHIFPIDGELPTLVEATDGRHMAAILGQALHEAGRVSYEIGRCDVELVDYARWSRAVLRYRLEGEAAGASEQRSIFGKVFDGDGGALVASVTAALRQRIRDRDGSSHVLIPRAFGWRPDLRLSLLEAIPGESILGPLLKAQRHGPPSDTSALDRAIGTCARIAALLHTSGIPLGGRRTLEDELLALRQELAPIHRFSPQLGARLSGHLASLERAAYSTSPLSLVPSHGDFTRGQILFDGETAGLLDFDGFCQAEPALDLGHFRAYLRLGADGHEDATASFESIGSKFLEAYVAAVGDSQDRERLKARVSLYEGVSMLRRAVRCWQKFKSDRVASAVSIFEEEVAPRLPR